MKSSKSTFLLLLLLLLFIHASPGLADVNERLAEAERFEEEASISEAFSVYRELFETEEDNQQVVLGLLRTAVGLENWEEATRALKQHERLVPESPAGARHAARLYFYRDQLDTALAWAEKYHRRQPGHWRPFHFQFRIHYERRDYVNARSALSSAMLRAENNPWVMLDNLQLKLRQRGQFDDQLFSRLRELAEHPKIYEVLSNLEEIRPKPKLVRTLLKEGLKYFPAARPPLIQRSLEADYRHALALVQYRLGDEDAAANTLSEVKSGANVRWFRILLNDNMSEQVGELTTLLRDHPDNLIHQWHYSRLVRKREGLRGERRRQSGKYFYREYQNLRFFDYSDAALAAINRSLEMYPLNSERQFELARFYGDRGWTRHQRRAARRVRQLGFRPASRINDYIGGISSDTPANFPGAVIPSVRGVVSFNSFLAAPPGGRVVLKSMLTQIFYHHPAFELTGVELEGETEENLGRQVRETELDGAFRVEVDRWGEVLDAQIRYYFPGDKTAEVSFYDSREVQLWRLLDSAVNGAYDKWPWRGRVYSVGTSGAGVNLGKVHGITGDDRFQVSGFELPVSETAEDYLKLEFPTPVFRSRIQRGSTAEIISGKE